MSSSDPLIRLNDVKKVFYTDEVETHALSGHSSRHQKRRIPLNCRPIRVWQVHPAFHSWSARYTD